ncbi:hypothetical protein, partial [Methanobacterium formicicum]|uniref:hypothetical protein n=1 Tax=Methanobacterium formicicum TaxID=2162 RepID=UPI001ED98D1B
PISLKYATKYHHILPNISWYLYQHQTRIQYACRKDSGPHIFSHQWKNAAFIERYFRTPAHA